MTTATLYLPGRQVPARALSEEPTRLAPEREPELAPGMRLARCELVAPIAGGGMGTVWLAKAVGAGLRPLVAVKIPAGGRHVGEAQRALFFEEARIASRIDHPNVARVFTVEDDGGVPVMVMEWVAGDSLATLHRRARERRGGIPLPIALRVVADASAAVHAVHELCDVDGTPLDVVHRDVSPHNVVVDDSGLAKLVDFGIAKARRRRSVDSTSTDVLRGKVGFMAPEYVMGDSLDRRSDVWALGATLYTLIVGNPPYASTSDTAALFNLASGERFAALPPDTPSEVVAVVRRALAYHPDDRFVTAAEMRRAIESAMFAAGCWATARDVVAFCSADPSPQLRRIWEAAEASCTETKAAAPSRRVAFPTWAIAAGVLSVMAGALAAAAVAMSAEGEAPQPAETTATSETPATAATAATTARAASTTPLAPAPVAPRRERMSPVPSPPPSPAPAPAESPPSAPRGRPGRSNHSSTPASAPPPAGGRDFGF